MSTSIKKKIWSVLHSKGSTKDERDTMFHGTHDDFVENGGLLLQERISLFDGITNPIHCFSIDELNNMNAESFCMYYSGGFDSKWYKCNWEGRIVLIKLNDGARTYELDWVLREIVVASKMATHMNVHKLIGCCLETKFPAIVYEWEENGSLEERILGTNDQNKVPLEWNERLRIAWEISHAVAFLHTAFPRPIVHRDLTLNNVLLDRDNAVKLSNFSFCIAIPKGKKYVEDVILGSRGYLAPEYFTTNRVAESTDVYSFGKLFLALLTGKAAWCKLIGDDNEEIGLEDWVRHCMRYKCISDIIDPSITIMEVSTNESLQQQLRASIELALRCASEDEYTRPTMVDVATELKSMIRSSIYLNH